MIAFACLVARLSLALGSITVSEDTDLDCRSCLTVFFNLYYFSLTFQINPDRISVMLTVSAPSILNTHNPWKHQRHKAKFYESNMTRDLCTTPRTCSYRRSNIASAMLFIPAAAAGGTASRAETQHVCRRVGQGRLDLHCWPNGERQRLPDAQAPARSGRELHGSCTGVDGFGSPEC